MRQHISFQPTVAQGYVTEHTKTRSPTHPVPELGRCVSTGSQARPTTEGGSATYILASDASIIRMEAGKMVTDQDDRWQKARTESYEKKETQAQQDLEGKKCESPPWLRAQEHLEHVREEETAWQ